MSNIVESLVEMGFNKEHASIALSKTSGNDLQETMEWLLANQEELIRKDEELAKSLIASTSGVGSSTTSASSSSATPASESSEPAASSLTSVSSTKPEADAKSIKCDDCGKLFTTTVQVEFHAAKTNHSNFSESTEEKKPLTEEEKQAQIAKVEELLRQKRQLREEQEKQEELEREKMRIRSGKDILEAKKKMEELEMKKLLQQRKQEKEDERIARERVRKQIEQDKLARKAKFNNEPMPEVKVAQVTVESAAPKDYNEAKLQIRLTNGSVLTQTFKAKEPLSVVRLYVELNRTDTQSPFALMTSFPRKTFTDEDYDKPLDSLGLTPSAVIIVTKR